MLKPVEGVLSMSSPAHGTVEVRVPGDDASQPETLEIIDSGHLERCERLPASPPSTIALAGEIVGTYRYADFGREVSVMLEDGVLYLDLRPVYGQSRFQLEPLRSEENTSELQSLMRTTYA